jgi:branched-chain amino acid transport system ATP-binding protein
LLEVQNLASAYGRIQALKGVSLEVKKGEIVCLLGGNASGKSTTMKSILGLVRPTEGSVHFEGKRIDQLATGEIVRRGISLVPEGRRIFGRMTVHENLVLGSYVRRLDPRAEIEQDLERVFNLFPRLRERTHQFGGTMSGGEQQMLAIGRALMSRPRLLLMDEPSMGLSPAFVDQVFDIIQEINGQGTTILVVEQNAAVALSVARRGYVMRNGLIAATDTAQTLLASEDVRRVCPTRTTSPHPRGGPPGRAALPLHCRERGGLPLSGLAPHQAPVPQVRPGESAAIPFDYVSPPGL